MSAVSAEHTAPALLASALQQLRATLQRTSAGAPADLPAPLDALCGLFGLSPFERDVLLLCAGVELDGAFAALVADAQNGTPVVTFSLAMAALPGAHWSALTPTAPLRRWRLIDFGPGTSLTTSPLRISEAVLHFLLGVPMLSEQLLRMLEPVQALANTPPSLQQEAALIADSCRHACTARQPLIHMFGAGYAAARQVAAAARRGS